MEIYFLTTNYNFFGQMRKPWASMDVELIKKTIESEGVNVKHYLFSEIIDKIGEIKNQIIFYGFSQKEETRGYISDIISFLDKENTVIPSLELLKCHENKGYQELLKKQLGFESLKSQYVDSINKIDKTTFKYPFVLKTIDGSNGKGVYLIKQDSDLVQIQESFNKIPSLKQLDLFRRKYLRKKKKYPEYPDYNNRKDYEDYLNFYILKDKRFIVQEFVEGLEFDYRVLILNNQLYITKRHNKDNDFRASGAKKFDFNFEVPTSILDYALSVFDVFKSPFLSIDIAAQGDNYFLIEYQALHFGVNVYSKNKYYYSKVDSEWSKFEINQNIEEVIAKQLVDYIKTELA